MWRRRWRLYCPCSGFSCCSEEETVTDREKVNVRGLALEVLLEVTEQKEYSHLALREPWKNTSIWRNRTVRS